MVSNAVLIVALLLAPLSCLAGGLGGGWLVWRVMRHKSPVPTPSAAATGLLERLRNKTAKIQTDPRADPPRRSTPPELRA